MKFIRLVQKELRKRRRGIHTNHAVVDVASPQLVPARNVIVHAGGQELSVGKARGYYLQSRRGNRLARDGDRRAARGGIGAGRHEALENLQIGGRESRNGIQGIKPGLRGCAGRARAASLSERVVFIFDEEEELVL